MMYAIKTILAMTAAVPPAHVALPAGSLSDRYRKRVFNLPWKIVLTVTKYVPIGPTIIAAVKPRSLYITALK